LTGIFLFLFIVLVVRVAVLQLPAISQATGLAAGARSGFSEQPVRGEIKIVDKLSPEPTPLATNIDATLVYAVPKDITNPVQTARLLAPVLAMDEAALLAKFSDRTKVYVPLKRKLLEKDQKAITELGLTGIAFDTERIRFYPERQFLSNVVGFLGYRSDSGNDKVGVYGLERRYDDILSGQVLSSSIASKNWFFNRASGGATIENGSQLILTVDRSVQLQAEQILAKAVSDNLAEGGCIVVMDPSTGAILAMASNPTFDPNEYNKMTDQSVFSNSCTSSSYEPGSVFKAVTMAAGLEAGAITPDTTYNDTGQVVVDGYTIKNSDGKGHGIQTMTQVLEESLNTGVIFVKTKIGNQTFLDFVRKFGFGVATGIDLPEAVGSTKNLDSNIEVNFDTASFGQGVLVTPLQMVRAYAAIANGGKLPTPYVVASRVSPEGKTIDTKPTFSGQIISPKTAATLSAMLVSVVEHGHGKRAGVNGYYVAGKTGTAQVAKKQGGGYDPDNNIGTFVGFAPVENPKFVMLVRVNHPRTVKFAESTAAPAWGQLAQFLLSYYNIPPTRAVK
jgi:cell division protein FtsI/penicillin-binding protein 2